MEINSSELDKIKLCIPELPLQAGAQLSTVNTSGLYCR